MLCDPYEASPYDVAQRSLHEAINSDNQMLQIPTVSSLFTLSDFA